VKNVYKGFISQIDANKSKNQLIDDIARLLKIKIKSNSPRKPPRVLLFGMRGSGRKSQAAKIADKFGLVYVSTSNIIKAEISKKEKLGQEIASYTLKGEMVPDEIVANLVERRLRQTDCQVNGWILTGFPATENQITLFNSMKFAPSSIIVLEIDESISYERIEGIRVDPTTGVLII
jgi:adenylate kinase